MSHDQVFPFKIKDNYIKNGQSFKDKHKVLKSV
jgi:hypothetical protein